MKRISRPRPSKQDPHYSIRQDARLHAHDVDRLMVQAIQKARLDIAGNQPYFLDKEGPLVRKHVTNGHKSAQLRADSLLLDSIAQTIPSIRERLEGSVHRRSWSSYVGGILYNLNQAIALGIWREDGSVEEWDPSNA